MNKFYDQIAPMYDQVVQDDIENRRFPYGGYDDLQDIIANYIYDAKPVERIKILDLGIGTGRIYEKINPQTSDITGIDNSKTMLEIAHLRVPEARLYDHNILLGLPEELAKESFDFIIIDYLFKHLDIHHVTGLISQLISHLSPFGRIFIGGILFLDAKRRQAYLSQNPADRYLIYHYHTYADIIRRIDQDLALSFMEINAYTGLMIVEKYHENPLHFEETLVKYKSNTVKWKSSHPQKHRE